MARCLAEANITRDDRGEELRAEKGFEILHDLIRKVGSLIEHREQSTFDLEFRIAHPSNLSNGLH